METPPVSLPIPTTREELLARAKELVSELEQGFINYAELRIAELYLGYEMFKVNEVSKRYAEYEEHRKQERGY